MPGTAFEVIGRRTQLYLPDYWLLVVHHLGWTDQLPYECKLQWRHGQSMQDDPFSLASVLPVNIVQASIDALTVLIDAAYHVLRLHPGDTHQSLNLDYDRIRAVSMIHYFRADRPGQARGIPDITPALPLFAHLRRYTLAVLTTAEIAALPGGILYTDAPANGEADHVEPMDLIELERGMLMTMRGAGR